MLIIEKDYNSKAYWQNVYSSNEGYFIVGLSSNDYSLRVWDSELKKEICYVKDPENFQMSNFNTSPKIQFYQEYGVGI